MGEIQSASAGPSTVIPPPSSQNWLSQTTPLTGRNPAVARTGPAPAWGGKRPEQSRARSSLVSGGPSWKICVGKPVWRSRSCSNLSSLLLLLQLPSKACFVPPVCYNSLTRGRPALFFQCKTQCILWDGKWHPRICFSPPLTALLLHWQTIQT